jgi:hypothetical protein
MSGSNGEWGQYNQLSQALADAFDKLGPLPDEGENPILDQFCQSKRVTLRGLLRVGAHTTDDPEVIAYVWPEGIKYRNLVTGKKWAEDGSHFPKPKIIRAGAESSADVIVCEGETDGARLTEGYGVDACMLHGTNFNDAAACMLGHYDRVFVGTDNDEAGEAAWCEIVKRLPHAIRFAPGAVR